MACTSAPICAAVPAPGVSEVAVSGLLRRGVDKATSQRVFTGRHHLDANDPLSALGGRKAPTHSVLAAVGVTRARSDRGGHRVR